jgi:hypothetical protein
MEQEAMRKKAKNGAWCGALGAALVFLLGTLPAEARESPQGYKPGTQKKAEKLAVLVEQEKFEPDEKTLNVVGGSFLYETKGVKSPGPLEDHGALIATDKRVIAYTKGPRGVEDFRSIPYGKLESFEQEERMTGHVLRIYHLKEGAEAASCLHMRYIKDERALAKFLKTVDGLRGTEEPEKEEKEAPEALEEPEAQEAPEVQAPEVSKQEREFDELTAKLKELNELREQGILTEEEFQARKKELLKRL